MPLVLSEQRMQQLDKLVQDLVMRDTCDQLRLTRTLDTEGGGIDTYPPIATMKCAVTNAKPKLARVYEEQLETRVFKLLLLPRGTRVLGDDRFRVTSSENGISNTLMYRVIGLYSPQSFDTFTQVDIEYDASL